MFALRNLLSRLAKRTAKVGVQSSIPARTWAAGGVWGLWSIAVIWTAVFIARHGHNLPANDEWAFVSITYASWADKFEWLGERHMEHRFPLARAVFLGLLEATGHDYRAGMWMTLGLFAATAATLILAARRLRGHTSLADAAFPFLFLHVGHTENLLMGYQIVFTITVLALALFTVIVVHSAELPSGRSAVWGALCLVPIAVGGWLGLVFVPTLLLWVAWQAWEAEDKSKRWIAIGLLIAVGTYLVWSVGMLIQAKARTAPLHVLTTEDRIRSTLEVIAIGLGPAAGALYADLHLIACILLIGELATACALARIGLRKPEERGTAWGLLALLLGVWVFALGIGMTRESGTASRYSAFSALGVAVSFLAAARYLPRGAILASIVAVVGGSLVFAQNVKHGHSQEVLLDEQYRSVVGDINSKMPIDVLAHRHVDFWHSSTSGWRALWDHGFPLLCGVPGPVGNQAMIRADFRPDGEHTERHATFARYRVELDGGNLVSVVRVRFQPRDRYPWETMGFLWADPATGEKRRSIVRPWVDRQEQFAVFWIDGPLTEGELFIGRSERPIEVLAVEYSLKPSR